MKRNVERKLVKQISGCPWGLYQGVVGGCYFFIWREGSYGLLGIQIGLGDVSRNFFQCRAVAVRMYDAFVEAWQSIRQR